MYLWKHILKGEDKTNMWALNIYRSYKWSIFRKQKNVKENKFWEVDKFIYAFILPEER